MLMINWYMTALFSISKHFDIFNEFIVILCNIPFAGRRVNISVEITESLLKRHIFKNFLLTGGNKEKYGELTSY